MVAAGAQYFTAKWLDQPTQILRAGAGNPHLSSFASSNCHTPGGHPEGYLEAFGNIYKNFALTLGAKISGTTPTKENLDFPTFVDGVRGMAFIDMLLHLPHPTRSGHCMSRKL